MNPNPILNPYFTFATTVIPSNDFFIGNDSSSVFQLFDNAGNLQLAQINQTASQICDTKLTPMITSHNNVFDIGIAER
ncbi:MAG: hypothetical protein K2Q13_00235 [Nitrosomonas sp.]|uniref:hypothetical protein n=1 Tax=Nitrosomonas sp. TaxID=42353 RepID=UPI0026013B2B|nr:hypothetical protein [Nitrosomonas sp.]MBY0473472.1 hypothetical protein [Nitrosomonas sp.]